ncbi:sensor histidine kinase [Paenibacillus tarimensis]|nr:sensor histidine kinase [Paenibacillus tarimensis]
MPAEIIAHYGLSASSFAGFHTTVLLVLFSVYLSVAVLIIRKRPAEPLSWIAGMALISFHTSSFIWTQWESLSLLTSILGDLSSITFVLFLLLFPNGRVVDRRIFWFAVIIVTVRNVSWYFPEEPWGAARWPIGITLLWMLVLYGSIAWYQLSHYRNHADAIEKQQTKWVLFGFLFSIVGLVLVSALPVFFDTEFYQTPQSPGMFVLDMAVQLLMLPIPVTLCISLLRKRLWDIDPIMKRTILYGCLSTAIIALYSFTVWYLSVIFQTGPNKLFSIAGAALVAVLFAPLKERLQKLVNRMIYGVHNDPFLVLDQLSTRLREPSSPEAVLDIVVRTVRDSLRLPYAAIQLNHHGAQLLAASSGVEREDKTSIPLIVSGYHIGSLHVCSRSAGEGFSEADWKLLHSLARQASTVVQSVKQAMDIQLLAEDLQETREKLIFAREEERRTIRKNLHDDIAPRLAAMRLTSSLVVDWIRKDPDRAAQIMNRFKQDIGDTVDEIRGIVYDLRPQALDELGLRGAIQQRIEQIQHIHQVRNVLLDAPLEVELKIPEYLPILPAAVEVGAYRIVTEALLNVAKHAKADYCLIHITLEEEGDCLCLEVADNGVGLTGSQPSTEAKSGLGLLSIRERAEELGGSCRISQPESGGSHIYARLPLRTGTDTGRGQ